MPFGRSELLSFDSSSEFSSYAGIGTRNLSLETGCPSSFSSFGSLGSLDLSLERILAFSSSFLSFSNSSECRIAASSLSCSILSSSSRFFVASFSRSALKTFKRFIIEVNSTFEAKSAPPK